MKGTGRALALAGCVAFGGFAMGDDDLSVVKRAVAANVVSQTTAQEAPKPTAARPEWLKVRVFEKGENKPKVTVNLPIALVRALGDEWPRNWGCLDSHRHDGGKCDLRLNEILDKLQPGQSLVEVDDDENTVKIWVE